jgi:hypothetical protein
MSFRTSLVAVSLSTTLLTQGSYSALSFEGPTFVAGRLAGDNLWNGCKGPGYQDHPRFGQAGPLGSGIRDHPGSGKRDHVRSGKRDQ